MGKDILKRLRELDMCDAGKLCETCAIRFREEVGPHLPALLDVCEAAKKYILALQEKHDTDAEFNAYMDALARMEGK